MLRMLIICLFFGFLWGVLYNGGMALAGMPVGMPLALSGGLLFGLVFFLIFTMSDRRQKKRIRLAAQQLPSFASDPVFVMLIQGKYVHPNALFLCEDCLCLANLEQKTPTITSIPSDAFIRAEISGRYQLTIHLTESRSLTLRTGAAQHIFDALKQLGWLPFQH